MCIKARTGCFWSSFWHWKYPGWNRGSWHRGQGLLANACQGLPWKHRSNTSWQLHKSRFSYFFMGWNPPYLAWASPQTKPCLKDTLCQESWEQAPCVSLKGPKHPSKDEGSQGPASWIPCAAERILKAPKIRQMINFWHCRCPLLSEQTHWSQYCS